jgi:hypothetical protein
MPFDPKFLPTWEAIRSVVEGPPFNMLCRRADDFAIPGNIAEFGKNLGNLSNQFTASASRRFQFHKRSQLFIRVNNETLFVVPSKKE